MKQNITLALDKGLLKRVRAFAASRGVSVSGMLSEELLRMVERGMAYEHAKRRALAHLGKGIADRGALHERKDLR